MSGSFDPSELRFKLMRALTPADSYVYPDERLLAARAERFGRRGGSPSRNVPSYAGDGGLRTDAGCEPSLQDLWSALMTIRSETSAILARLDELKKAGGLTQDDLDAAVKNQTAADEASFQEQVSAINGKIDEISAPAPAETTSASAEAQPSLDLTAG